MPDDTVTSNFVTPRENQGSEQAIPRPKTVSEAASETVPEAAAEDLGAVTPDDE